MNKIRRWMLGLLLLACYPLAAQFSATFKPNAALGEDAMIHRNDVCNNWVNTNWGNHPEVDGLAWTWYGSNCGPGAGRGLIRFSQLNTLPAGAVITYAELRLFGVASSGNHQGNSHYPGSPYPNDNSAWVRRITSAWAENTVTWATQPTTTSVNQVVVPASTSRWNYNVSLDVTSQVIAMATGSGANNHGFMLQLQDENYYRSVLFASSDHPDAARWPELLIKYDIPCEAHFTYCVSTQSPGLYNFKVDNPQPGFTYKWDFGDGNSGVGNAVSHHYASGSYEVCLYASGIRRGVECKECIKICVNNPVTTCSVKFKYETPDGYSYLFTGLPDGGAPVVSAVWDFGDGKSSTDWPDAKYMYSQSGSYTVCLTVKYANGCEAKYCDKIEAKVPCDIGFVFSTPDGYDFKFLAEPVGGSPLAYAEWDFGDGNTAVGLPGVAHHYSRPGIYIVCVTVKYQNGCVAKFCREVTVGCTVSFTAQTNNGSLYYFTGIPAGPYAVASAEWDFGDGSPFTAYNTYWPDTKHQYTRSGTYKVCVKVTYKNGCVAKYCTTIRVEVGCGAIFTSETTDGYLHYFNATPSGPADVDYVKWDFGDGNQGGPGLSTSHQYDKPGIYRVCVTIVYVNGCVATYCREVKVDCVVDFKYDTDNGQDYYFYGQAFGPYDVSSVEWDFGDGTTSSEWPRTKHSFRPGTYLVCVTVKYSNGCVAKRCYKIVVGDKPCEVKFDYYVQNGVHYFTGIPDGGNGMVVYAEWDFGDGSPVTGYNYYWPETKHIYDRPGQYKVCVKVKYESGCEAKYCTVIDVYDHAPRAAATPQPKTASGDDHIKVVPNPVNEPLIRVQLYVQKAGNYRYTIFNANGKAVQSGNKTLNKGLQQVVLLATGLLPGKYWIEVVGQEKRLGTGFVRL
jgi:PKD repeat protein